MVLSGLITEKYFKAPKTSFYGLKKRHLSSTVYKALFTLVSNLFLLIHLKRNIKRWHFSTMTKIELL